jgi:hypothetical protein
MAHRTVCECEFEERIAAAKSMLACARRGCCSHEPTDESVALVLCIESFAAPDVGAFGFVKYDIHDSGRRLRNYLTLKPAEHRSVLCLSNFSQVDQLMSTSLQRGARLEVMLQLEQSMHDAIVAQRQADNTSITECDCRRA